MRKLFTILALLLSFTGAYAQLTPELLYYRFDGTGGGLVPNQATNPPAGTTNATIMGGLTQGPGVFAMCNNSLIGTGITSTTDYLNTGWTPNLGNGSWTISFRSAGISTNATLYYVFGDLGTNSFRCFTNGVAGSTNYILRGAGLTDILCTGCALSTPTMVTYVYDNTLNNVKSYLNGVLNTTVAQTAPNLTGTGPLKVMGYSANVGAPAGGQIDDWRLYNRALNAAEVAQLYNAINTGNFLGADQTICQGDTVNLYDIYTNSSGVWSTGPTATSISVTTSGTYSLSITAAGCGTGVDSVDVIVNAAPTPNIGPDINLCMGDSATLDAGPGYASYLWNTTAATQSINIGLPGCYDVVVTDSIGCDGNDSVMVYFITPPAVNLGTDTTICANDQIILDAGAGFNGYMWSTLDSSQTISAGGGTFSVMVTDSVGCSGGDSITISTTPNPVVNLGPDVSFCAGSNTTLDAGAGFSSYLWSNQDATQTTTVNTAGTYSVVVTDSAGCSGNDAITVTEDPLPVAGFTNSPSGLTVAFTNTSTNATTSSWNFGDTNTSNSTSPSHTYTSAGTYTVTLVVTNACGTDSTTTTITITSMDVAWTGSPLLMQPNPAQNEVLISATIPGDEVRITVMSIEGKVMLAQDLRLAGRSLNHTLDVSSLANGMYLVKLESGNGQTASRLTINH